MDVDIWPADGGLPVPRLDYVFTVSLLLSDADTTPPLTSGAQYGQVSVLGGRIHGPRLNGDVLPGGGDTPVVRPDDLAVLDARYFFRADDGTVLRIHNRGLYNVAPAVDERLDAGEDVSPNEYYIRTTPRFDAPAGPHEWLNRHIFIGIGRRTELGNEIHYFAVR